MTCQLAILILVVSALTLSPISVVMIFVKMWKKGYGSKGVSYCLQSTSSTCEAYDSFNHHGTVSSAAIPFPLAFKLVLTQ